MIYFESKSNLFKSTLLDSASFVHGFGTKQFGNGKDTNLLKKKFPGKEIIAPLQIHSAIVKIIGNNDHLLCDGLVTQQSNTLLSVITADCVPMIYADIKSSIIAISHQGWKGTLQKLPQKVIESMVSLGAQKEAIICIFGPAINECCYEIYGERKKQFIDVFGSCTLIGNNREFLSLYTINRKVLINSGIESHNIDIFPFCTSCNASQFYSYFRDGSTRGEIVSFIG